MTTVSVSKREGLSPFFERCFDDVSEAARFAESWLSMHVTIRDEAGQTIDPYTFMRGINSDGSAVLPFKNTDGSDAICPFCGAPEAVILADDGLLHACDTCDRAWYIDSDENVLAADRCPACESPDVAVGEQGARTCGACGHRFFFDGLTYVDPASVAVESEAAHDPT
jgi:ribosomal protein L37AE/L43A